MCVCVVVRSEGCRGTTPPCHTLCPVFAHTNSRRTIQHIGLVEAMHTDGVEDRTITTKPTTTLLVCVCVHQTKVDDDEERLRKLRSQHGEISTERSVVTRQVCLCEIRKNWVRGGGRHTPRNVLEGGEGKHKQDWCFNVSVCITTNAGGGTQRMVRMCYID